MTAKEQFRAAYHRVCLAQRVTVDVDHMAECWRIVSTLDPSLFDAAATRLNSQCRFLPKPAEWHTACLEARHERERREMDGSPVAIGDAHCAICQDTGWQSVVCTSEQPCWMCRTVGRESCGAVRVTECRCRAANPVYQRRRMGRPLMGVPE